jgi:hypothetical protein
MNKHFIQVTNGLVPIVVLLLLVVALVAGQARANLPGHVTAAAIPALSAHSTIILDAATRRKIESLPQIVDTILALPADIEITINALTLPAINSVDRDRKRPPAQ